MPTIMNKKHMLIAALVTLLIPVPAIVQAEEYVEQGNCAFSKQLQDPTERLQFTSRLREAREASMSQYGETFANTVQARMSNGEIMSLDTFSVDCMSCHDGINAKEKDIRFKNNAENRTGDILSVVGSHPIGMDYGSYAYSNQGFRPLNMLKAGMELIDGKVGCLTCHNPLNPKKYHLATADNVRSQLCYTCHNK